MINGTEEEKNLTVEQIKSIFSKLYNSRTYKQDRIILYHSFASYKNRYIEYLQRSFEGRNYWAGAFDEFNIFNEGRNREEDPENFGFNIIRDCTIYELFKRCEIPDGFTPDYDALPENCQQIIMDYVYTQAHRENYKKECTAADLELLRQYLISIGEEDMFNAIAQKITVV
jgi:hypothetical protein